MKLNCDLGESFGNWTLGLDEEVIPLVDQANIACGFHASDPVVMAHTIVIAAEQGVEIGAHPGYPDLQGFGRRAMALTNHEIRTAVLYQIGALQALCRAQGARVSYVKPHGALYLAMMADERVFRAILDAVADYGNLTLMIQAGARGEYYAELAADRGVPLYLEAFADRQYEDDGSLMSRSKGGAVFHETAQILAQVRALCEYQQVVGASGQPIPLRANTLCIHGDNPESIAAVRAIRELVDQLNSANNASSG